MLGIVTLIALIVIGYFIIEHIRRLKWEQKKKAGATVGAFAFITTLILLTVTGKLYILAALGTTLVVFAKRLLPFLRYLPFFKGLYQRVKSNQSSKSSKQSTVETSLLKMILNHESGELDGELLDTVSKGRYLSEFDLPDLIALYTLAETQYPDSTEVLAAYLDRKYGSDWREAANAKNSANEDGQNARGANSTEMTEIEAYEILGLEQNATEEEIMAAHRKLILKLHPDRGGSNYLTAKINQAKDLLLSRKGR